MAKSVGQKTEAKRRARTPDRTAELFPQFSAGIERAKRVRVVLRKLAGWPPADIAALIEALRERADTVYGERKIGHTFNPGDTLHLNVKSVFHGNNQSESHPLMPIPPLHVGSDRLPQPASQHDNTGESVGQPLE